MRYERDVRDHSKASGEEDERARLVYPSDGPGYACGAGRSFVAQLFCDLNYENRRYGCNGKRVRRFGCPVSLAAMAAVEVIAAASFWLLLGREFSTACERETTLLKAAAESRLGLFAPIRNAERGLLAVPFLARRRRQCLPRTSSK